MYLYWLKSGSVLLGIGLLLDQANSFNSLLFGESVRTFAPVAVSMVFEVVNFFDPLVGEDFHAVVAGV